MKRITHIAVQLSYGLFFLQLLLVPVVTRAQQLDTGRYRVKTDLVIPYTYLGTIKSRPANEITSSNWIIGCETLDRDFTDYDAYKEYLVPLGIRRLRMQAGWDKTEKVKGTYNWAWLDHIIDDAVSRGLQPWLQTSYGNHNYPGGGGDNLGAGVPHTEVALKAWDKWVTALVTRYKDRVTEWEVWNEPNFGDNNENTPEKCAALNIRTAEIIKRIQPQAIISGLSMGHISLSYADRFFKVLHAKKKFHLFDNFGYHDYVYNPDANIHEVITLRNTLHRYAPNAKIRQGENGAPSAGGPGRGAIGDWDWSELSQAKWNTRRMLGNLGHDIECSILGIIDMAYNSGPIKRLNVKGILQSDSSKKVIRPKMAYYAMQNVAAIFDNRLERIKDVHYTYNPQQLTSNDQQVRVVKSTDRSIALFGYRHPATKKQVYTIWSDEHIPTNSNNTRRIDFTIINGNFDQPVLVDVITGSVYEIPGSQWSKKGNAFIFKGIPVYDAPVLIADKSLLSYR